VTGVRVYPSIDLLSVATCSGHKRTTTQATHLKLAKGGIRETIAIEHEHDSIPVVYARRRCLYDHLQHLQDLLADADIDASIPIDEKAVTAVET